MIFCDWLLSRSMMFSGFIHVVECTGSSFLLMVEQYSIVWIWHNAQCVHSSINGHLGWFHLLAAVNNTALNFCTSIWVHVFNNLGYISRSGIIGSYDKFIVNFLRNHQTVSHFSGFTVVLPSVRRERLFPFLTLPVVHSALCSVHPRGR